MAGAYAWVEYMLISETLPCCTVCDEELERGDNFKISLHFKHHIRSINPTNPSIRNGSNPIRSSKPYA